MEFTSLHDLQETPPTVLTVGFFDGVHRGHRAVIDRVISAARTRGALSAVLTFEPHPQVILTGRKIPLLTTLEEKAELLGSFGVDKVIVAPFDLRLAQMAPEQFVAETLVDRIGLVHIVIGYDHSFGRGATGNAETITALGGKLGFEVEIVGPVEGEYGTISSSGIRDLIGERGDVTTAARQLGRLYNLAGRVVHGDGRGKELGFPTANLQLEDGNKIIPLRGVYAVKVNRRAHGTTHDGVMNIGVRPTVTAGETRVLEVHLLEFDDDLYDEILTIEFLERIRDEQKFEGVEALKRQIGRDIEDCIRIHNLVS